ncbi:hypothetical protein ACF1BU_30430 [Streptomyces sp. NPDC014724]|uniref:hypothetical protein n=1 Tax=unclassified Streptomyces TaxID=2593676 RepID=UPI0036F8D903
MLLLHGEVLAGLGDVPDSPPDGRKRQGTLDLLGDLGDVLFADLAAANWPITHTLLLVVDVYTVLFVLGLHAASVTRPHVLADGTLRVRHCGWRTLSQPIWRGAAVSKWNLGRSFPARQRRA